MLFKSVFARYMVAFMLIILLSFLILALIIASMVQSYSYDQKQESLERIATSAKTYLETEYDQGRFSSFTEYVTSDPDAVQRSLSAITLYSGDMFTIVTNSIGIVLAYDDSTPKEYITPELPQSVLEEVSENGILLSETNLKGAFSSNH